MKLKFPAESFRGVLAVMPTPSSNLASLPEAPFSVDTSETARATRTLMASGIGALATNGSLGEMATLSLEEWSAFNESVLATAREMNPEFPVFVGVTTLSTRDTIARARAVHALGGRGLFVGRPFWCALDNDAALRFYKAVADAVPDMSILLYDNSEAFKGTISTDLYAQLAEIPQVVGVKYIALTPKFNNDMRAIRGRFKLLPVEVDWLAAKTLWPREIDACWSAAACCGPEPVLALQRALERNDVALALRLTKQIAYTYETFLALLNFPEFAKYNIAIEKARFDEAGYIKAGPARHPYDRAPDAYLEGAREAARRWVALAKELKLEDVNAATSLRP